MLASVNFYDNACGEGDKVHNVGADRNLPTKFATGKTPIAQQ